MDTNRIHSFPILAVMLIPIKRIRFVTLILINSLIYFGCKQEGYPDQNKITIIDVSSIPISSGFKASDLVSAFDFIPLEQTKNSLIGEINKVIEFRNKLIVIDRFSTNSVFVFNSEGKFLWKLGSIGNKNGQYIYPHDVIIDTSNNNVLVLDSENRRINEYSLENGEFIGSTTMRLNSTRFTKSGDNYFFVTGSISNLVLTDKNFNTKMRFFPRRRGFPKTAHESFPRVGDSLSLFHLNYVDTVFRIVNDKVYPYLRVNYGDAALTYEETASLSESEDVLKKFPEKKITYRYYFENNDNIIFTYAQQQKLKVVLFRKRDQYIKLFPYDSVSNDITFESTFPIINSVGEDGSFIAVADRYVMNEKIKSLRKEGAGSLLTGVQADVVEKFQPYLQTDSGSNLTNPVLVKFKFKQEYK